MDRTFAEWNDTLAKARGRAAGFQLQLILGSAPANDNASP
jgi:hypothetical protein